MAVLHLHGLKILLAEGDDPASGALADLVWHRARADHLPPGYSGQAVRRLRSDGEWLELLYGTASETHCTFAISPDSRRVETRSLASTPPDDLLTIFAEPVMRTIFRRRGMLSLHGAALEMGGKAIILVGDKGAGKSTLSAALVAAGWTLVSDDLVRVTERDGRWFAEPGFAHLKMTADTAKAMGHDLSTLPRRWTAPEAVDDPLVNKYVRKFEAPEAAIPLHALHVLAPASADCPAPEIATMPPAQTLQSVMANISDDPADPGAAVPPEILRQALAMIARIPARSLAIPRRFEALQDTASLIAADLSQG